MRTCTKPFTYTGWRIPLPRPQSAPNVLVVGRKLIGLGDSYFGSMEGTPIGEPGKQRESCKERPQRLLPKQTITLYNLVYEDGQRCCPPLRSDTFDRPY